VSGWPRQPKHAASVPRAGCTVPAAGAVTCGRAVQAGRGGWDIAQHGLTWGNSLQVVGSLLGLGGNYATWRRLPAGGAQARTPAPAASPPTSRAAVSTETAARPPTAAPTTPTTNAAAAAEEAATGVAPATVAEVGAAAEADWLYFSNAMSQNASRGSIPASPLVAGGSGPAGGNLVHMTTAQNAALINAESFLRGNIYAGPASNAHCSGWSLTLRTGLPPGRQYVSIPIPAAGEAAFSRITPISPFTAWQRATVQQYTARGILNLQTGEFTRLGINWNQVQWYALDVAFDGTIIFVGYSALCE
jgi:hypothetical protein